MHTLQPKYSKLKPDEIIEILQKFNISKTQLPRMKIDDSQFEDDEGISLGDVIKFERKSDKEKVVYYRIVVA